MVTSGTASLLPRAARCVTLSVMTRTDTAPHAPLTDDQLRDAAQRFGTPLYAYSAAELDAALARVRDAFGDARVWYAMKANPNLTLLRRLHRAGVGFECVSLGELGRAVHVGAGGDEVIVNGPAKSDEEYALGGQLGATFIVDRVEEAALLPRGSRVLVRVNPGLEVSTHDHLATGAARSKFGVRPLDLPGLLRDLRAGGHTLRGLHLHVGSAVSPTAHREAETAKAHRG